MRDDSRVLNESKKATARTWTTYPRANLTATHTRHSWVHFVTHPQLSHCSKRKGRDQRIVSGRAEKAYKKGYCYNRALPRVWKAHENSRKPLRHVREEVQTNICRNLTRWHPGRQEVFSLCTGLSSLLQFLCSAVAEMMKIQTDIFAELEVLKDYDLGSRESGIPTLTRCSDIQGKSDKLPFLIVVSRNVVERSTNLAPLFALTIYTSSKRPLWSRRLCSSITVWCLVHRSLRTWTS